MDAKYTWINTPINAVNFVPFSRGRTNAKLIFCINILLLIFYDCNFRLVHGLFTKTDNV